MNYCVVYVILGSLFFHCHSVFPPGSCDGYENITEPWRNHLFRSSSFAGFSMDDASLVGKWWRFTGIGGDRIVTGCYGGPIGGFSYSICVPFSYPKYESATATTGNAHAMVGECGAYHIAMSISLCPGGFYIYKPSSHPHGSMGYITYHYQCNTDSCGPLAQCSDVGGCVCVSGYEIPPTHRPTPESYGCADINECERTSGICGPHSYCSNTIGSYFCKCQSGFNATDPELPAQSSNQCIDNDECFNSTVCGPDSVCINTPGAFTCECQVGFAPTQADQEPSESNICIGFCDGYENITEPWRNYLFRSSSFAGFPMDDASLVGKWWRFTGIGGDKIVTGCYGGPIGGFSYSICVPFSYPTYESATATTGNAHAMVGKCGAYHIAMSISLCPGGFYIYKPSSHPHGSMGYITYHYQCNTDSCGPLAQCSDVGGCVCVSGYELPPTHRPTPESYGCADINECERTSGICGPHSYCSNTIGSYFCKCQSGFNATDPELPAQSSIQCIDINECLENVCGYHGSCTNYDGSYNCKCHKGFHIRLNETLVCKDNDECFNSTVCGPDSVCINTPGAFTCECQVGFAPTQADQEPSETNICIDVDECVKYATICGPDANCTNSVASYNCGCFSGYQLHNADRIASITNPCTDIDECSETPSICGKQTVCTNVPGTFFCSCPDGFFPSTGIMWTLGVSFCQSLQDILDEIKPAKGQTKERAFLGHMDQQLKDNAGVILPEPTVANSFSVSMEVSGVGPNAKSIKVSSEGDGEIGSVILGISDRLVSALVQPSQNQTKKTVKNPTVDLSLETIGPGSNDTESSPLSIKGNIMEINMESLAKNNNGSAAAAFMTLYGMDNLLSHQYFETENRTEMYSDVITAILPSMNNTNLTEPVNFTIRHKKALPESGLVTCVYWEEKTAESGMGEGGVTGAEGAKAMRWSIEGCWVAYTNENYTVCSCSHLSTFALILQIKEPPPDNPFLDWLNRCCVIVGLFFFALAILTFVLSSWNPKINNTARLHLCLSLSFSHLLLLWSDKYVEDERACTVMAGLLHFLVVASFVWMLLEALQLHLLVRRLSKVQVIHSDGLPRPLLYLIGYGVPFVIVGVSALVYSDGYGATEAEECWLSTQRNFNWALTGPVIVVLGLNWILFCATLWSLKPTLANMKSDVSQSKDTRLIVFKIMAQFVILGCTWILGLYQSNLFFQVLFIILNSQQGTVLFIVHCLLNKEVRQEYIKWLTCSFNKQHDGGSVKDALSLSEDLDKADEQTG